MAAKSGSYRRDKTPAPPTASRRRSQSVSAVQRRGTPMHDDPSISAEFSNRRDNPLFWARRYPPSREDDPGKNFKIDPFVTLKSFSSNAGEGSESGVSGDSRGRSVKRNSYEKKGIGRSLSRTRREPMSGIPSRGNHEITKERRTEESIRTRGRGRSESISKHTHRTKLDRNGLVQKLENAGRERIQDPAADWGDVLSCSWRALNLEDVASVSSFSEAEEKSMKDVQIMREKLDREISSIGVHETLGSEVIQAISDIGNDIHSPSRRKDAKVGTSLNLPNCELVRDFRRDYVIRLEESEVRAEKLRAELAAEELRQQELDRILRDMLTYSRGSTNSKSLQRRVSNERKAMSRQLTEDAFAYFDECVSLSTFDSSSEFSAPEDPNSALSGPSVPLDFAYPANRSSDTLSLYEEAPCFPPKQIELSSGYVDFSSPSVNSRINEVASIGHTELPYGDDNKLEEKRSAAKSYMRCFGVDSGAAAAEFDIREYSRWSDDMLIDRVLFNSRIVSGDFCYATAQHLHFSSSPHE